MFIETKRLYLREIVEEDAACLFAMDSDPDVMRYIGVPPLTRMEDTMKMIGMIREQYTSNGIGRWTVVLKENNEAIGWGGLKLIRQRMNNHEHFYDNGYRFMKEHWGKGYATEVCRAVNVHAFTKMGLTEVFAYAMIEHKASRHVLEKSGFRHINDFYNEGIHDAWYRITKEEFLQQVP